MFKNVVKVTLYFENVTKNDSPYTCKFLTFRYESYHLNFQIESSKENNFKYNLLKIKHFLELAFQN